MIKFEHVSKVYGEKEALSDLTLSIKDGEIFGLIGHNGAGKTTTISILTSIIDATYGQVYIDDLLLTEHRDQIKKKNRLCTGLARYFLEFNSRGILVLFS